MGCNTLHTDNPHTLGNLVSLKLGSSSITSLFPSPFSYLSIITAARRIITIDSSSASIPFLLIFCLFMSLKYLT
jgi:hypothetical protein